MEIRSQLADWRFHVLDSRVGNHVSAVYAERADADAFVRSREDAFPGRYRVIDTVEDTVQSE
jgi:hypothetical protein